MTETTTLFYSHDPMCSFCWAFRPVWAEIQSAMATRVPEIEIKSIMGGLAADSDEPMPEEVRLKVRAAWQYIEQNIPGTRFNYDFWDTQQPRRSTYPACRAVIAAKLMQPESEQAMILAIQQAYYLHAQNPSNEDTLLACAESIGLDRQQFTQILRSRECAQAFDADQYLSRSLGISSFPSLVLARGERRFNIPVDYNDATPVLDKLFEAIALL